MKLVISFIVLFWFSYCPLKTPAQEICCLWLYPITVQEIPAPNEISPPQSADPDTQTESVLLNVFIAPLLCPWGQIPVRGTCRTSINSNSQY